MDMEPTDENPQWEIDEKLDMLQHHLVADTQTMDYLFMVLNVRCDMCGNEFWIRKPQDADPKSLKKISKNKVVIKKCSKWV